jgi:hypothetical protein
MKRVFGFDCLRCCVDCLVPHVVRVGEEAQLLESEDGNCFAEVK